MDFGWRFALGHAWDADQDFGHATGYFSYMAKTGYGDGPAASDFDDRAWRILNVPHDWVTELPFDKTASHSHGYKTVGRNFPGTSVGWYRKKFFIPESDLGRRIIIEFDGIHRNATLWINGFYIGQEHSGYSSFQYDITDYLKYGGDNVIAVRVDATLEEGWFYEGAGIYRHVWLTKTAPLHVGQYGTFVTSEIKKDLALITIQTTISNESRQESTFDIIHCINNNAGTSVATRQINKLFLKPGEIKEYSYVTEVDQPDLWSLESPYLYKLITSVRSLEEVTDRYETTFGIRSVRFDPDKGFFLNGQHIPLQGTNNHQDHAGVGTAIPDALQEFRINRLKAMGANAYRCSHNPPTPELLDACDRLGMLVLDENRLMGSSPEHFQQLKRMILRDRNHPCVIAWSLGNEEWAIEGNITGARIASTMQEYARGLDPTRRISAAVSGGRVEGISTIIDMMNYNYLGMGDIDEHHGKYPHQPMFLSEERTTQATRGIYEEDAAQAHMAPTDRVSSEHNIEIGLQFCAEREFMSGLFYWTGFDYRGEANPYGWPQVLSQFGIIDLCGFPKDSFYYLKSWWTDEPVIHIFPHWNWQDKEGQVIHVRSYSNCDEVELFLNGNSLGRKSMPHLSHIEWEVPYERGVLLAKGYNNGQEIISTEVETTGEPASIRLIPDRSTIKADKEDVSVVTVQVEDRQGWVVPTAGNEITFSLAGPGKIIGLGNGNPSSHESDVFPDITKVIPIDTLKMFLTAVRKDVPEVSPAYDDSKWSDFIQTDKVNEPTKDTLIIIRGSFVLPAMTADTKVTLFTKSLCENQSIYVNGHEIATNIKRDSPNQEFKLEKKLITEGKNVYAVTGTPFMKTHIWQELNTDPGVVQVFIPTGVWQRKAFNGLAQIILQSDQQPGELTLNATSPGLEPAALKIQTQAVPLRPAIPE
ncbi:MAG: DUF4982 domain-containing protein [Sedimentisphaerales bacterium]|nr:DUF4982 domain-containing protein [Sedimentisphaerales bacterium]